VTNIRAMMLKMIAEPYKSHSSNMHWFFQLDVAKSAASV